MPPQPVLGIFVGRNILILVKWELDNWLPWNNGGSLQFLNESQCCSLNQKLKTLSKTKMWCENVHTEKSKTSGKNTVLAGHFCSQS